MVDAVHDDRTYRRVEVITGRRRRRDWTPEEKDRIVGESLRAEANISEVARRNGVSRGLLNIWRRQARALAVSPPTKRELFVPVLVESDAAHCEKSAASVSMPAASGSIKIEIGGATIRVPKGVDRATLEAVISALRAAR
ncbi:MAG: transposase [Pseudomonadota bacterium]|nr:transposase [Pseudomonadota bacterium]